MCFKKLFGKEEVKEEVVEEVKEVERRSIDDLITTMNGLAEQLNLVLADANKQAEEIAKLKEELKNEYEATCAAKEQIVKLLNDKAELENKLNDIEKLAKINNK